MQVDHMSGVVGDKSHVIDNGRSRSENDKLRGLHCQPNLKDFREPEFLIQV